PARPPCFAGNAGQGGGQEFPQRRTEPECVPAQAHPRGGDPQLGDAELPADPVHVLRARRGRRSGRDVPRRHRASLHVEAVYLRAVEVRTRRYGAYEVNATFAPVEEDVAPTVYAAKAAFEKAGVAPEDVDVIQ